MNFEQLVKPEIAKALKEIGIETPTQIQEQTIPLIQQGKDVIGMSKTGSGKTLAFGAPLLEKVHKGAGLQAVIISPTRELAVQIAGELLKFAKYLNFRVATVYGGVSMGPQIDAMQHSEIMVGTPGRVLDHLYHDTLPLQKVKFLVLDEADKMVEMGFWEDVSKIIEAIPQNRQMILFGATLSKEIDVLKAQFMKDPQEVQAESHVTEEFLQQYYYELKPHEKFSMLVHLLKKEETKQVIIFCSARSTVELVAKNLRMQGVKNEMIHGKLSQNRRLQVIRNFDEGKVNVLVASAVAARGLHIEGVSHVINYDLSKDPQEYVHRVGRTARAGESGKAITLLAPKDHDAFRDILRRYDLNVQELPVEQFVPLRFERGMLHDYRGEFRGGLGHRGGPVRPGFHRSGFNQDHARSQDHQHGRSNDHNSHGRGQRGSSSSYSRSSGPRPVRSQYGVGWNKVR